LCAQEAAALNAAFLWSHLRPERPFVALKLAVSLDGFIADTSGRSRWISGERAREYVHWLRAGFDAIAVGRRTAELDDPDLTVRGALTPRVAPRRLIFTRSGALPTELRLIETASSWPTVVVTATNVQARLARELGSAGVSVVAGDDLSQQLAEVRKLGVRSMLVEGGGTLAGALLDRGLVDRLYLIQAPRLLGDGVPAFGSRGGVALNDTDTWVVTERRSLGPDTLLVADRELCLPGS
jgi:diaminohydroxyphosphoribosylaminopyrimidine deaminase/5-amino-6-(5-phosphoribosylamino)uracil reductase